MSIAEASDVSDLAGPAIPPVSQLRQLAYRASPIAAVLIYAMIRLSGVAQINALLEEDYAMGQTLALAVCSALTGLSLTLIARYQSGGARGVFHYLDYALAMAPLVILWSGLSALGTGGTVVFMLASGAVLWTLARMPGTMSGRKAALGLALVVAIGVWSALTLALFLSPVGLARSVGTMLLVLAFLGLILLLLQALFARPLFGVPVVLCALLAFVLDQRSYDLRVTEFTDYENFDNNLQPFRRPVSIQDAFDTWLASRNDLDAFLDKDAAYPVFLISSEGGGGYAAAHAYLFLRKMQDRCPNFAQHVFAITGVSGGAVGNAMFWSTLGTDTNPPAPMPCDGEVDVAAALSELSQDNLSPVIGAMLFRDLPNRVLFGILPGPNRSEVLVTALSGSLTTGDAGNPYFSNHYWEEGENSEKRPLGGPAIIPVATNIVSGKPYIIAPFEIDDLRNGFEQASCGVCDLVRQEPDEVGVRTFDIGFYDAAVVSASFPYVTPSLAMDSFGGRIGLVDGGYLDNSGSEVLLEIVKAVSDPGRYFAGASPVALGFPSNASAGLRTRNCYGGFYDGLQIRADGPARRLPVDATPDEAIDLGPCDAKVRFITITIRAEPSRDRTMTAQNFFLDPVSALLNGRSRRAELARLRLYDWQCAGGAICSREVNEAVDIGYLDSVIRPQDFGLPLGWKLPLSKLTGMEAVVAPDPDSVIDENFADLGNQADVLAWQADVFATVADNPTTVAEIMAALSP